LRPIATIIRRAGWSGAYKRAGMLGLPVAVTACLLPVMAFAAGAEGDWWVHDKQARIRIADCGGIVWGVISWEAKPGVDTHNPDPAKRSRPMLGVPIVLGMKPAGTNKWSGSIYNSAFGQTVTGAIALNSPDTLRITGCVLGFLCGGENWTRADADPPGDPPPAQAAEAICKSVSAGH
jgi:uncharacterized protein (DUF2147 family)